MELIDSTGCRDAFSVNRRVIPAPEDCTFYQTIELPDLGVFEGSWDHRATESEYFGNTVFRDKRVLDVGPANGYFSFEMERRGATVTALDLGEDADWDAVPHPYLDKALLRSELRKSVKRVENAFHFSAAALGSSVRLAHGSVYDTAQIVDPVDVALMSNVLQHFRDPFRALEEVAKVVKERLIVSESLWDENPKSRSMRLIPSVQSPHVTQSWWIVPPPVVVEILRLLGFPKVTVSFHYQRFNGSSTDAARLVRHYTVCADRFVGLSNDLRVEYGSDWHGDERSADLTWRWSAKKTAVVSLYNDSRQDQCAEAVFGLASNGMPTGLRVCLNGEQIAESTVSSNTLPVYLPYLYLKPGSNTLRFESDLEPSAPFPGDTRCLTFALYGFKLGARDRVSGA